MKTEFDIAIVGMAGRFPGALNLEEFWHNLAGGIESITRFSDADLLEAGVPESRLDDASYVKAAPVLENAGHFDADFFGYSPMEARTMDPQHRLLLELAHEALESAGYAGAHRARVGVFAGAAMNTYFMQAGLGERFNQEYIPTLIGNDKDFLSTRISYKLNLKGPSITVQTACSSSMVAVHLARQSLLSEETDLALAGGISVRVPPCAGYFCDGGGMVSPDGHVRAFDAQASGTVFGSGGGILVLKRLEDAIADGDTIHAVIKGTAVNNDGSEKAGFTAPSVNSQADAVVEALTNAGVGADDVGYVEAHGSGTPVGDPIEVSALTKAFRSFTQRRGYCALGSVKTNIGHIDAAAAVAGMIKTVLALKHRRLPPSLHFTEPNPEIDFPSSPFYVNTQLSDWNGDSSRYAAVMSTGMGGTNACVILGEAPEPSASTDSTHPHLLLLSAKTEDALRQATVRLRKYLTRAESVNMSDVAYTLQIGRKAFPYRRCVICADRPDAINVLGDNNAKRVLDSRVDPTEAGARQVIFLLPGIGDHYVGMAHELYERWPVFKEEVDRCAQILETYLGRDIRTIIYPPGQAWKRRGQPEGIDLKQMLGRNAEEPEDPDANILDQTLFVQPALFTIEYAVARLWQSFGVKPHAIVGHSMGEYVAACLAGVFSLEDALRAVAFRARLVDELPHGAMLAVTMAEKELQPMLPNDLSISLINGPQLCVVAGPAASVAEFERRLEERNIICRRIRNGHAFHSKMLDPIVPAFEKELEKVRWNEPTIPFVSNVTGKWITRAQATSPAYWAAHANHTARFHDALNVLWQCPDPILLEAGPGRTLGVLAMQHPARQANGKPSGIAVSSIRHAYEKRSDDQFLWHAIGRLWLSGLEIDWAGVHERDHRRRIPLPTYPFSGKHYWLEPAASDKQTELQNETGGPKIRKNPDVAQWLYAPSWKRHLPASLGADDAPFHAEPSGAWLVFADDLGFASMLKARLESAGHDVITVRPGTSFESVDPGAFTIDPGKASHYEWLVESLQKDQCLPERVIHAWNITGESHAASERDRFDRAQDLGFYSLAFLARAFAASEAKIFVLSNDIHEVRGDETLRPEKSTLLGPCMAIRQEYPNIIVKSIDLELATDSGRHEAVADLILGELLGADLNLFVAFRNGQRWIQTYVPVPPAARPGERPTFREGGVYMITGGLGAIGLAMAQYLAENYRAKLVLVARSTLPALTRNARAHNNKGNRAEDSVDPKVRALERIEELGGEVLCIQANVAEPEAMTQAVDQAYQRYGVLHGIIHGAGLVGDASYHEIKDIDHHSCDGHFQAKAHGLMVLDEVLRGKTLDFRLLMSSMASVLGGIGQAAYASANIYMDSFARRENQAGSSPWLSVNWDVWRLDRAASGSGMGATLKELGMTTPESMKMLETVLAMKTAGQLVVSTGHLEARIDQWIKLDSLNGRKTETTRRSARSAFSGSRGQGHDAPRDEVEQQICRIWEAALGIDGLGIHDHFAQLGGHSLLAIRIVSDLRRAFQIDLPIRTLFDAPTIAELAVCVQERLICEIEALSDEEARELVSNG